MVDGRWSDNLLVGGVGEQELVALFCHKQRGPWTWQTVPSRARESQHLQTAHPPGSVSRLKHMKLSCWNGIVEAGKVDFFKCLNNWQDNWEYYYFFTLFGACLRSKSLSARIWRLRLSALMWGRHLSCLKSLIFVKFEIYNFLSHVLLMGHPHPRACV